MTITKQETSILKKIGYQTRNTAGTTVLADDTTLKSIANSGQLEVIPIRKALKKFPEVQDMVFSLIDPHKNSHTELVFDQAKALGHFIRVFEGNKVNLPVQAFNIIETPMTRQYIHNITVLEKNSKLELIGGSTVSPDLRNALHVCVSETYLGENAQLKSTSIEHWGSEVEVYSYGSTLLEKNSRSIGKEILMTEVKKHHTESVSHVHPGAICEGSSVIFAPLKSRFTGKSTEILKGQGATSNSILRSVSMGGSIDLKSEIVGEKGGKGFTSCNGLLLNDEGFIRTTPALQAKVTGLELSHESSVGRIDTEHISYLMASGLNKEQAQELIISGFLGLDDTRLPKEIKDKVKEVISQAKSGGM
jgi:uncharacterized protein